MARKKIVKKDNRKDDLDPSKDEFVEKSMSALDWAVERRKSIGALLGTILLVWLAIIIFSERKEAAQAELSTSLSEAFDVSVAPIVADEKVAADVAEDVTTYKDAEARTSEAVAKFDAAIKDAAGSSLEGYASFQKASVLLKSGDYKAASELLKDCVESDCAPQLKQNVQIALATALEGLGQTEEAGKVLADFASSGTERLGLWSRYGIAAAEDTSGNSEEAKKQFLALIDDIKKDGEPKAGDFLFAQARARVLAIDPDADVPELPSGINPQILQQLMQMQQAGGTPQ